jgi:hypothetical protein
LTLRAHGGKKDYCYAFDDDNLGDASRRFSLCATSNDGTIAHFSVNPSSNKIVYTNTNALTNYNLNIDQNGQHAGHQSFQGQLLSNGTLIVQTSSTSNGTAPGGLSWITPTTVYLPLISTSIP